MCSTTYQPCSIFICTIEDKNDLKEKNNDQDTNVEQSYLTVSYNLSGRHERPITSFDWSCSSNTNLHSDNNQQKDTHGRIVTCGEDCRVFVWMFQKTDNDNTNNSKIPSLSSSWIATQVLIQQNVSMTPLHCQWDTNGEYFAMGMGGNHRTASVEICCYENDRIGWVSQQIGRRKIKSSVLCVAWRPTHPNNNQGKNTLKFVACGGCDYRCRIFYANDEESVNDDCELNFGDQCADFDTDGGGWVIAMTWSKSGKHLAFASQKSCSIFIIDCSGLNQSRSKCESWLKGAVPTVISLNRSCPLPMCSILFLDESTLFAGGYDGLNVTLKLDRSGNKWSIEEGNTPRSKSTNKPIKIEALPSIFCLKAIPFQTIDQQTQYYFISISGSEGLFNMLQIAH